MNGIYVVFLVWLSVSQNIQCQVFTVQEPQLYFDKVQNRLWQKIKDHGLSNFLVEGHKINYNVSSHGIDLIGDVVFEDGFIMDLASVDSDDTQLRTSVMNTEASVTGRIHFRDLEIVEDFRADFPAGMTVGTVILRPESFAYAVVIKRNFTTDAITTTVSLGLLGEPVWEILPDNAVTTRIRRFYTSQNLGNNNIIRATFNAWISILQNFLDEIVPELGFPDIS